MSDTYKKDCPECGKDMTLLLNDFVCDWCDGLIEEEWKKSPVTEPLFTGDSAHPTYLDLSPSPMMPYIPYTLDQTFDQDDDWDIGWDPGDNAD